MERNFKNNAVTLRNLGKTYRDFWRRPTTRALYGLNLDVAQGEIFGLLGPNGSGKSTTIKLILGLLRPTSGSVAIFGHSPNNMRSRARIGYLPEITNLHRFLSPKETLGYYAGLFGLDGKTTRIRTAQLLKMVGLEKAANREIGQFSKGMARRVGMAQALINNPDVIILDEPTSGLDPIAARAVKDWLRLLANAGKTIFMTSHLLADVEDICDNVAILCDGQLRAKGSIRELLQETSKTCFTIEGLKPADADDLSHQLAEVTELPVRTDHPRIELETFFLNAVANRNCENNDSERRSSIAEFLTAES